MYLDGRKPRKMIDLARCSAIQLFSLDFPELHCFPLSASAPGKKPLPEG
jgi:hypothetical protein